jgi:hypothetical protein
MMLVTEVRVAERSLADLLLVAQQPNALSRLVRRVELIWVSARPGTKRKLLQYTSNRDRQGRIYSLV